MTSTLQFTPIRIPLIRPRLKVALMTSLPAHACPFPLPSLPAAAPTRAGSAAFRQLVALGRDLWRQRERRARLRRIRADGRTRSLDHPGVAGCDGTNLVPGSG